MVGAFLALGQGAEGTNPAQGEAGTLPVSFTSNRGLNQLSEVIEEPTLRTQAAQFTPGASRAKAMQRTAQPALARAALGTHSPGFPPLFCLKPTVPGLLPEVLPWRESYHS